MTESIHDRLDREVKRLQGLPESDRPTEGFIVGVEHAANIAYRMETVVLAEGRVRIADLPVCEADLEPTTTAQLDKQVVHVNASRFTALIASGVDTREFDKGLAALGIELVVNGEGL